jgi:hypothetical protein
VARPEYRILQALPEEEEAHAHTHRVQEEGGGDGGGVPLGGGEGQSALQVMDTQCKEFLEKRIFQSGRQPLRVVIDMH